MGTPTWTSPLHYDTGGPNDPGIHADINFNPGVGATHTILSITVTRDSTSPYDRIEVTHASDFTNWISPIIPVGTHSVTQAQINAAGFTVMEDINGFTAVRIGSPT